MYIYPSFEGELAGLRESEERLKQQQQESTRRENVLVMRLATKEHEVQDLLVRTVELIECHHLLLPWYPRCCPCLPYMYYTTYYCLQHFGQVSIDYSLCFLYFYVGATSSTSRCGSCLVFCSKKSYQAIIKYLMTR